MCGVKLSAHLLKQYILHIERSKVELLPVFSYISFYLSSSSHLVPTAVVHWNVDRILIMCYCDSWI